MSISTQTPSTADLALVSSLAWKIGRGRRLPPEDLREFTQAVHLRLLETKYAAFRQFQGRASLKTYLTVVVTRLFQDWQNQRLGKWRPSAAARRLGTDAVRLEQLTVRDGLTVGEAIETLNVGPNPPSSSTLRCLADRLPARARRRMAPEAILDTVPGPAFEDPVEQREQWQIRRRISAALGAALAQLTEDDRRLIVARFRHQMTVSALAATMGVDSRLLYRRCDQVLKTLKRALGNSGVVGPATLDPRAAVTHSRAEPLEAAPSTNRPFVRGAAVRTAPMR